MAELLSDRYELVHEIAAGKVAALWRGNLRSEAGFVRPVAVRVLRDPWDRDPGVWSAWARAASELARRSSAHLEQWIDLVVLGNRAFVVTEWIEGISVRRWREWHVREQRKVPWPLAAAVGIEILRGLHDAGVRHGGVDARSVRISRTGAVKLTRFGAAAALATVLDAKALEELGVVQPAPELLFSSTPGPAADIFSVGALLFELLAGRPPFDARAGDARDAQLAAGEFADLSSLRDDAPTLLVALVETALRADPAARFTSPEPMIRGLAQLLKSGAERSDPIALAESVAAACERPAPRPQKLPEQATMHVELSEVTVLPASAYEAPDEDRRPRYHFAPKERRATEAARGLRPAPQHLTAQESEALPLLLTRRANEAAEGSPTPLGIAPQKTEFLDADQLERVTIPGSEKLRTPAEKPPEDE